MFNIKLKIIPQALPNVMRFQDDSTSDETVESASLIITKTDLVGAEYPFESPFIVGQFYLDLDILDKDYALNVKYTVITDVDTYTKTYEFVTLGYSNQIKKERQFVLVNDLSIQDQEQFQKESLTINYYRMVAKDRCRFSDLVGAQKALDAIQDLNLSSKYVNNITYNA